MQNSAGSNPPIDYPTIFVDGVSYKLRLSLSASYLLELAKVDMAKLRESFQAGDRNIELFLKLCAAMMGNFDGKGRWRSLAIDPLALADLVPMEEFPALTESVLQALLKAQPAGTTTAQTQPATTGALN